MYSLSNTSYKLETACRLSRGWETANCILHYLFKKSCLCEARTHDPPLQHDTLPHQKKRKKKERSCLCEAWTHGLHVI